MNKLITIIIIAAVLVGGSAFYGGMKYTESKSSRGEFSMEDLQSFRNLSSEERMQRSQELGANIGLMFEEHQAGSRGGMMSGGDTPLLGEVISQTEDSLTIKLNDGSTKIVFVSSSTQITKMVSGVLVDIKQGEQVFVGGKENPDGSYTAQTIQIRP